MKGQLHNYLEKTCVQDQSWFWICLDEVYFEYSADGYRGQVLSGLNTLESRMRMKEKEKQPIQVMLGMPLPAYPLDSVRL